MSFLVNDLTAPWRTAALLSAINTQVAAAGLRRFDTAAGIRDGEAELWDAARLPAIAVEVGPVSRIASFGPRLTHYETPVRVIVAVQGKTEAACRATARLYLDNVRDVILTQLFSSFDLLECTGMNPVGTPYANEPGLVSHMAELSFFVRHILSETDA